MPCVIGREEVLILHLEETETKFPKEKCAPLLMEEDWVVLCQAMYQ